MRGEWLTVPTEAPLTHIQFRRFAGCPVCNLHLRSFIQRNSQIAASGIHEVVVFHSTAEALRKYESDLPFDVIPDPGKRLYLTFGVESRKGALLNVPTSKAIVCGIARSAVETIRGKRPLPPLDPEGGRNGLPADFLFRNDGLVIGVNYGEHASDQWSVDELLRISSVGTANLSDDGL